MRRRSFLATGWLNILFQVLFLAVLYGVGRNAPVAGEGAQRTAVLLLLVGVPSSLEVMLLAGWQHAFWRSFGLTLAISAGILALSAGLMRGLAAAPAHDTAGAATPRDLMVWGCALILLVAAGFVKYMATRDVTFQSESHGIAFQYPASRLTPALLLSATAGLSPLVPAIFSGSGHVQGPFTISLGARKESVQRSAIDPTAYRGTSAPLSLAIEDVIVAGKTGVRTRYAYLTDGNAAAGGLPRIVWAYTDIIPTKDYTSVFTYEATPENFRQQEWLYRRILASITWTVE